MKYLVFAFDTEDYVHEYAAEGALRDAALLTSLGVRGCFNIVGRMARALVKWGRQDVIEAIKKHEISTHSLAHTHHPTINEYTDVADYDAALAEFLRQESECLDIIAEVFGARDVKTAIPPGNNLSYVAYYGYDRLGISAYGGNLLQDEAGGRPVYFCNLINFPYHMSVDKRSGQQMLDRFEEVCRGKAVAIVCHHPQMSYTPEYVDFLDFNRENVPEDEWKFYPQRPAEATEQFYADFRHMIELLKEDPEYKIVTFSELIDVYSAARQPITLSMIPELRRQLNEYFFPVTTPDSYCISDILLACRDLLMGKEYHECGKVYGFLEKPYEITSPVTLSAHEVRQGAMAIGDGFLPTEIRIGDRLIGTADWLFAAMDVLCGAESVTLTPRPSQIDLDQFPLLRDMDFSKEEVLWSYSFKDEYISNRQRLQSWTIRLPANTERRIFPE